MVEKTHKWSVTTRIGRETEDFLVERRMKVAMLLELAPRWYAEKKQFEEDYLKISKVRDELQKIVFERDKELDAAKKLLKGYTQ